MQIHFKKSDALSEILSLRPGVTALVGGGGKTSVMLRLARELSARGRVIVTTTTHIFPPSDMPVLLNPYRTDIERALLGTRCICVGAPLEDKRLCACALPTDLLMSLADYVLVEADGAKRLPLKAPDSHEPAIPACAGRVLAIAGLDGIGKRIEETAFRPALYAAVLQTDVSHVVTPEDVARVLCSPMGQRKDVHPDTLFSVVLNKADDPERLMLAQAVCAHLNRAAVSHVAVTCLQGSDIALYGEGTK